MQKKKLKKEENLLRGCYKMNLNIKQITLKKAEKYNKLGEAIGTNLEHCIHEGTLHCRNFLKRVKYYVIKAHIKSETGEHKFITNQPEMMVVNFYE